MEPHQIRDCIYKGLLVDIVLKKDQPTGKLTRGVVGRILTNSREHHRGIKVMLTDGQVGRVQHIVSEYLTTSSMEHSQPNSAVPAANVRNPKAAAREKKAEKMAVQMAVQRKKTKQQHRANEDARHENEQMSEKTKEVRRDLQKEQRNERFTSRVRTTPVEVGEQEIELDPLLG